MTTKYPGHAEQLARDACDYDGLAVVGGDGTILEVLNGMDCERQRLAIIPAGTGNSLARDLGLNSVVAAIDAIEEKNLARIDLMSVAFQKTNGLTRERLSASTLALGYPTTVAKTANSYLKGLGKFCYPTAATAKALFQTPFQIQLAYDDGVSELRSLTGLILNNTRHVGNFLAFPQGSVRDNAFDVMELNAGFWRQNLHNLAVLSKTYFYLPSLSRSARSLLLRLKTPQDLLIDGELYLGVSRARIRVSQKQLTCYQKEGAVR
jgi:diacylglycerol kinase (ATP)